MAASKVAVAAERIGKKSKDLVAAGFPKSTVSGWWTGKRKPAGDNLLRLSDILRVDARELR